MSMNVIKSSIIVVLLVVLPLVMLGCSYKDPEAKTINENYSLATLDGDIALIKHLGEKGDEIVACKNFVAYSIVGEGLLLCEESSTKTQSFWYYDLSDGSGICYETYSELIGAFGSDNITWTPLWVSEFSIKN